MMALLLRFICAVYKILLYSYPAEFRRRYGAEMARVFRDSCRGMLQARGFRGLLLFCGRAATDWLITTVREGMNSMNANTDSYGRAAQAYDGVPVFHICGDDIPRRSALVHGGFLSIAVFAFVSFLIANGGSRHTLLVGSHHPSPSHMLPARTSAVPTDDLDSEVKVKPYLEEIPVPDYFRAILVLGALDTDRDGTISSSEMKNARAALRKLDQDRDGVLSAEECGARFGPNPERLDRQFLTRARLAFMRTHPVLAALDADQDSQVSSAEMRNASKALAALDDGDGRLTVAEVLPDPERTAVVGAMIMLDIDRDGRISQEERAAEVSGRFRSVLERADRDGDGFVTEEELRTQFR